MHIDTIEQGEPCVVKIQSMLQKIDRLHLPATSRRDLESILVRQVSRELDQLSPGKQGMDRGQRSWHFRSARL